MGRFPVRSAILAGLGLIILLAGGLWLFATLANAGESPTLVFGATLSITGPTAKEGEYSRDGYNFYIDTLNSQGGLKIGDKKYRLKLQYYDDQGNPELTTRLYQKLITEDKVNFLLGPYGSTTSTAAAAVAEKYHLPILIAHGSAESVFPPDGRYTFGIVSPAKNYLRGIIALVLARDPGVRSLALLGSDEPFSYEVVAGTTEYARSQKLEVVYNGYYSLNAIDVSKPLLEIKAKNPDIILVVGRLQDSLLVVRQAHSLELTPRALGFTIGPSTPEFRATLKADADYIFGATQWTSALKYKGSDQWETPRAFADAFKARYPGYDDVPYHVAESTAALVALQRALEKAGSTNPEAVRDTLENLDISTFYGRIKFDERGMNIYKPMAVEQLQPDGKRYTVFPFDVSEKDILYPMPPWNKR
jgi:branched-chain amino acid transport system substrate-binding protein